MARESFGRRVVRGTLCRDDFRAEVTLTCSDVVPVGRVAPLLVDLRWPVGPPPTGDGSGSCRVGLALVRRFEAAAGDLRFERADGPTTLVLPDDTRSRVLRVAGAAATAGTGPDLLLQVTVDGEVVGGLPLTVSVDPPVVEIRAGDGAAPAPDTVVEGRTVRLRAVSVPGAGAVPPAGAGADTFTWFGVPAGTVEVRDPTPDGVVDVVGHQGPDGASGSLCVLLTPAGDGPAVLAEHSLAVDPDPGSATFSGQVRDQLRRPVPGATVELRSHSGAVLATGTTGEDGRFAVPGPPHAGVLAAVVDDARGWVTLADLTPGTAAGPVDVPPVTVRVPVAPAGTVGDRGQNQPEDVALVADRLVFLGRLTEADRVAEAPEAERRTFAAVYAHHLAAAGARLPLVRPATLPLLRAHPPVRPRDIPLSGPVGALPGARNEVARNLRVDVHAVQDRLLQLGLLSVADLAADRDAEPADGDPLSDDVLVHTAAAARRLDLRLTGGALSAVVPDRPTRDALGDPMWFGRLPLELTASVGAGGENVPADVRAVVARLREVGLLQPDVAEAESPPLAAGPQSDRVDEASFPRTIAALAALARARSAGPGAVDGLLEPRDPALIALNTPSRSDRGGVLGIREGGAPAENLPADVRVVQDRLRLLGFLAEADWRRERLLPGLASSPPPADLTATVAALRRFQREVLAPPAQPGAAGVPPAALPFAVGPLEVPTPLRLTGGVGAGQPNAPANVRVVQDRLTALGLLSPNDRDRERADPAGGVPAEANLQATLAAITALRQRLGRPDPTGGAPWAAHPRVLPGDETARFLDDPLAAGRIPVRLTGSVGELGWNHPADVRAVADRLVELGLLAEAEARRIDPARTAPLKDTDTEAVTVAIGLLRRDFLPVAAGAAAVPVVPRRIEVAGPLVLLLDNPLLRFTGGPDDPDPGCGLTTRLAPTESVGAGAQNRPADVRAVQDRLRDLRLLPVAQHAAEAADPAATAKVAEADLVATLAALQAFQELLVPAAAQAVTSYVGFRPAGHPVRRRVEPLDETLRMLDRPYRPPTVPLLLTSAVGSGPQAANRGDDVDRLVERLHGLRYLSTADYLAVRQAITGVAPVPQQALPPVVAAITRSQQLAGGFAGDRPGLVRPRSHTHRALQDPTWSTPTVPNPHADYAQAGPAQPHSWDPDPTVHQEITDVINAIEAIESGHGVVGETASDLHTVARTPASYGSAQTIGSTAAHDLATFLDCARFYNVDGKTAAELDTVASRVRQLLESILQLVSAADTEQQLQNRLAQYATPAQLATVRARCGLDVGDVRAAFRRALLVQRLRAVSTAGTTAAQQAVQAATTAGLPPAAVTAAGQQARTVAVNQGLATELAPGQPVRLSIDELGIPEADLLRMYKLGAVGGENREGLIQRALFTHTAGQLVRDAQTDDSGRKLGRPEVRETYNRVRNAPDGAALTPRKRAIVTAHLHNHGEHPVSLAAMIAHPDQLPTFDATYAQPVVRQWDVAHPGADGVGEFPPP